MKKAIALCLFYWAFCANAQSSLVKPEVAANPTVNVVTTMPEPEWAGQAFWLNDGKLVPLERQTATPVVKKKGLGFGGGVGLFVYKGVSSSVRVPANAEFVVRLEGLGDPTTRVFLTPLQQDEGKDLRQAVLAKVGGMIRGFQSSTDQTGAELRFTRYGTSSVKFATGASLPRGEYAIRTTETSFLFRVE